MNSRTAQRESLSTLDTAWLRMERPANLMMICGVMLFAERLDLARVREVIASRFLRFHRFRQRVVEDGNDACWETDPDFDLNWHVCRIGLPKPGDQDALQELVSELASTPLDHARPRWQFHVVDGYGEGGALVLRIHHSYADGIALIQVLLAMTDVDPTHSHIPAEEAEADDGAGRSAWERLLGPVTETLGDVLNLSAGALKLGGDWLKHPEHAMNYVRQGVDLAEQAAVIATMKPDSHTRFKGRLGATKRVAWADPLPLDVVKAVAVVRNSTVNDVVVSVVAGALRGYLIDQGDPIQDVEIRALVPVNLRPPGPVRELGNYFGLVFLSLPVGIEDPLDRLLEVGRRMEELKTSTQPLVALAILSFMGVAPRGLQERVLEILAANASMVLTNVPGPAEPLYFAGARITQQMFWVPQSGGIGMGISVLTYAGGVQFGVVADAKRVARPDDIVERIAPEFEALLLATLMQPWGPTDLPRQKRP